MARHPAVPYTNDQPSLAGAPTSGYFLPGVAYNVWVYYAPNQVVATGTIESSSSSGTTATLPISGHYRIDVSGAYASLHNVADAEFTSTDGWATQQQGYNVDPWFLGEGFGDVQVNGQFVDWGAFSASRAYSLSTTLAGSVNLAVFDGDSITNTKGGADWYGDNSGSLNYTITYVGP